MPRHQHAPARRLRSVLLRWATALVLLAVLVIGGAELLMRSFPDRLPPAMQFRLHDQAINRNEINSLPDKELGYLWRPRLSERMKGFNFAFDYTTDARGFRNLGPWPERADVVVLGDSQASASASTTTTPGCGTWPTPCRGWRSSISA